MNTSALTAFSPKVCSLGLHARHPEAPDFEGPVERFGRVDGRRLHAMQVGGAIQSCVGLVVPNAHEPSATPLSVVNIDANTSLDHSDPSFPAASMHLFKCILYTSLSAKPIALAVSAAIMSCSSAGIMATAVSTSVATRGCLLNRHSSALNDSRHFRRQPSPRRSAATARRRPMTPSDAAAVARAMGCTSAIPKTLIRLHSCCKYAGVDCSDMRRFECVCVFDVRHTGHKIFQSANNGESLTHPALRRRLEK